MQSARPVASLSTILTSFSASFTSERITIHDITESMGHRSFGFLLLIFALPSSLPIPGLSTFTCIPMLLIAWQMASGYERLILPRLLAERSMKTRDFQQVIEKVAPHLQLIERYMKPRLSLIASKKAERCLGTLCLFLALLLVLPIPFGNVLPGLGILFIAIGVVERDGVCVLIGTVLGACGVIVVSKLAQILIDLIVYMVHLLS